MHFEQKSDSGKSSCLKLLHKQYKNGLMLMWVKISSIEQLGYLVVVTTNKNYKVSVKDSAALEKSEKRTKVELLVYLWRAHIYLSNLKYQHSLFVLISSSFVFHSVNIIFSIFLFTYMLNKERKGEDNLKKL